MDFNRLEKLRKLKKMSQEELAQKIGMSKNGISRAIRSKKLKLSTLEQISEILGVPMVYFFDENIDINAPPKAECENCAYLRKHIDTQDKLIQELERDLEQCKGEKPKQKEAS